MANSIFINFAGANFAVPGQTAGDLFVAVNATTITRLADVATGQVLASGGVGVAPAYTATPTLTSVLFGGNAILTSDAAHVVAQRDGTNAQMFRAYSTFVSAANYRRATIGADATDIYIGQEHAGASGGGSTYYGNFNGGTGVIGFFQAGALRWNIINGGHLTAQADNTYDVGASGATRPRTGYFGTSVVTPLIQATARTIFDGTTTSSGAGAVGITGSIHEITTTGTGDALTLADGAEGQRLTVVYVAEGAGTDTAVLTPTNFGSGTTITFATLGQSAKLIFTNGKWYADGDPFGAVIA